MENKSGLSSVRTFFRHCPSCGRRFEIRLVRKEELDSQEIDEKLPRAVMGPPVETTGLGSRVVVQEDRPSMVDVEDFQYTYRCAHCGHQWSEVRQQEKITDVPKGYTGD